MNAVTETAVIDRAVTNDLVDMESRQATSTGALMLNTERLDQLYRAAEMMASARITVPKHLAGSPGDCLAVIMQAAQWGMNPFAVAQKTHVVNGALGYEAQLVNAVVSSSSLLATRISYDWEGEWKGVNGKTDKSDDRAVTVSATLKGEHEPRRLRVSMAQAGVRNSPNWESDPRQQLAYLATKKWARLYAPDVLLGVYTPDEIASIEARDMGPVDQVQPSGIQRARAAIAQKRDGATEAPKAKQSLLPAVLDAIAQATTIDQLLEAADLAKGLPREEVGQARAAYKARQAELEAGQHGDEPAGHALTFAQVEERMRAAQSADALDEAADTIGLVADEAQRGELTALYRSIRESLAG